METEDLTLQEKLQYKADEYDENSNARKTSSNAFTKLQDEEDDEFKPRTRRRLVKKSEITAVATEEKEKEQSNDEANTTRPRRLRKNVSHSTKPAEIIQSDNESAEASV